MPLKTRPAVNLHDVDTQPPLEVATLRIKRHQIYPKGDLALVNPVIRPRKGMISKSTPIGAIGSCFASRLQDWLMDYGYNFICTEPLPPTEASGTPVTSDRNPAEPWRQTARFGVVWTTGCIRQSFELATDAFHPSETAWRDDDRLMDPYRRGVWWNTEQERAADMAAHTRAVRAALQQCEVFVVTPGMAEAWRSNADNAWFQGVPPKTAYDPARHRFEVTSVADNIANLEGMYRAMRAVNPKIQLVISLSPVPLIATYRDDHCVVADTVSKSILRVAIDEFCRNHPEVIYFPSYEIVRAMSDTPFESDNRHVRLDLVERIMKTFMSSYGDLGAV